MEKKVIRLVLEKSDTGYSAYSDDVPGAVTAGESIEEIKKNYQEVLQLLVETYESKREKEKAEELRNAEVRYFMDLNTFFEYYSLFNKSELAKYLGINPSHLRRLSMPNMELSEEKAKQIQVGLQRLSQELKAFSFS